MQFIKVKSLMLIYLFVAFYWAHDGADNFFCWNFWSSISILWKL